MAPSFSNSLSLSMYVVRVHEADGLSMWGGYYGNIDPYCIVSLLPNTPGAKAEVRRGATRKKTTSPSFQESFTFVVGLEECLIVYHDRVTSVVLCVQLKDRLSVLNFILRVGLWHDLLLGDKVFLGQVNLSLGTLQTPLDHEAWYWLCARPPTPPTPANKLELGSLRIKIHYSKDLIYPLTTYDPLQQLLMQDLESPVSRKRCIQLHVWCTYVCIRLHVWCTYVYDCMSGVRMYVYDCTCGVHMYTTTCVVYICIRLHAWCTYVYDYMCGERT